MSGLSRQQFSTSDLENYLVESNQEWSKIAVAQYLTAYWGSSHYEAADMAAQLPNPRELVDRATKTVHLKKGDQEISYRVIREDLLNGLKEQYPLVADAMDRLVQRRLSNRGTSGWLYLPADRDFNVFVNQLERNAKRKLVQADLAGEALYNFRTGAELYPYCPQCVYVTQAPRGDLGCTKGDDPSVLDYSNRLTAGEADPETEKCPMFSPAAVAQEIAKSAAEQNTAGMFKDLTPMGIAPASLESSNWEEMLEDAVDRVKKNPEDTQALLIIDRAASEILSDEHQALNVKVQDYDQYHEDNSIKKKQT